MGSQLEQVKVVCCQLDDTKVTTRKKAEEQLRNLLNNSKIVTLLHNASSNGSSRDWMWQDVYRTCFGFLRKETEKLIDDMRKEKKPKNSKETIYKKKITAISLFKSIIRKARLHLSWSTVVSDILQCLDHPFMKETFSDDLLRILVDAVNLQHSRSMLTVGKDRNQWVKILNKVLDIFEDPPSSVNPLSPAQLLHQVLKFGTTMTNLVGVLTEARVWRVLGSLLTSDKFARADSAAKLEIVMAANCALLAVGLECREAGLRLGEDAVRDIIRVWAETRDNVGKEAVLHFLGLQMALHHPGGVSEVAEGALYGDRGVWTQQLKRIHVNIVEATIKNKMRQNKQKSSRMAKDYYLASELVVLGSEVLYQLDRSPENVKTGDVTQIVELDETQQAAAGAAPPAKRRRVSGESGQPTVFGLELLARELLKTVDIEDMKVPWLQLMAELVARHPDIMGGQEEQLLGIMCGQMAATKSLAVRELVCAVLDCLARHSEVGRVSEWAGLGHSLVTLLGGNQLGRAGHRLLRTLLRRGQEVRLDSGAVLRVYSNALIKLDSNSAETLVLLLRMWPINDVREPRLRESLLAWVSAQLISEDCPISDLQLVYVLPNLLHLLTIKSFESSKSEEYFKPHQENNGLKTFEETLGLLVCNKVTSEIDSQSLNFGAETKTSILSQASENVDQLFIGVAGHILDNLQSNSVKFITICCRLLQTIAKFLHLSPANTRLYSLVVSVFNDVQTATIKNLNVKDEELSEKMSGVLHEIGEVMSISNLDQKVFDKVKSFQPFVSKLQESLDSLIISKEKSSAKVSSRPSSRSRSHSRDTTPDPFDDFDTFSTSNDDNIEDDDFEMTSQADPIKDAHDLKFIEECLRLTALSTRYCVDKAEYQKLTIDKLTSVLRVNKFNEESTKILTRILSTLIFTGVEEDSVVEIGTMFMELAKNFMTPKMFNYSGMLELVKSLVMIIPILKNYDVNTRSIVLKILEILIKKNSEQHDGRLDGNILENIVLAMEQMFELGGEGEWAVWREHNTAVPAALKLDTDMKVPVFRAIPGFLVSPHARVRLAAGRVLVNMSQRTDKKMALLRKSVEPVLEATSLHGDTHSVLLAALGRQNQTFAVPVISCLVRLHARGARGLGTEQLVRAVTLVTTHWRWSREEFLQSALPLCVEEFLSSGLSLENFPIILFGFCSGQIKDFVQQNENVIVSLFLLQSPSAESLCLLSSWLGASSDEILKRNFHFLARYFLPAMAAQEYKFGMEGKSECANLADFISSFYGDDVFGSMLLKHFKSTIGLIFLAVNDSLGAAATFKIDKQEQISMFPLEIKRDVPGKVISLLEKTLNVHIWEEIAKVSPDNISKIAVYITSTLSSQNSVESNLRSLFSLYLWLDSISTSFTEELQYLLPFLAKYLSSHLLQLLNTLCKVDGPKEESMCRAILIMLNSFLKFLLEKCPEAASPLLKNLNYGLVNSVVLSNWTSTTKCLAVEVLRLLLMENEHLTAKETLSEIEDYPQNEVFKNLQSLLEKRKTVSNTLSDCLTRFLKTSSSTDHSYLHWPLRKLREFLKTKVDELCLISGDDIMKVTYTLFLLVKDRHSSVSEEALRCLAEIGPLNFQSELLHCAQDQDGEVSPVDAVLAQLLELLLSSDGELARVSAHAIANVLAHPHGQDAISCRDDQESALLLAFHRTSTSGSKKVKGFEVNKFLRTVDNVDLWSISEGNHDKWIVTLVTTILKCFQDGSFFSYIKEPCSFSPTLCEGLLKFLMYELLAAHNDDVTLVISHRINNFFADVFETEHEDLSSVRVMLAVVQHLRTRGESGNNCWQNNFLISNINYAHCASAALSCGDHLAALALASVWVYSQTRSGSLESSFTGSLMEDIVARGDREGERVLEIMFAASQNIGDKDLALGLGRLMVHQPRARIAALVLEGQLGLATQLCDAGRVSGSLVTSLHSLGLHHTLASYLQTCGSADTAQLAEHQQECAWRLEAWDQLSPAEATSTFHGCVLGGLESAVRGNTSGIAAWESAAMRKLKSVVTSTGCLESAAVAAPLLSQLTQVSELVALGRDQTAASLARLQARDRQLSFPQLEPVLTQRLVLLSHTARDSLDSMTLHASRLARQHNMLWVCNHLQKFYTKTDPAVRLEEATVIFLQGQRESGILLAKKLLADLEGNAESKEQLQVLSKTYLHLGNWLNEQKSEANNKILEKYLQKSVSILKDKLSNSNSEDLIEAYMAVATLCDQLYMQTRDFMNSSQFRERNEAIERNKKEAAILVKAVNKEHDLKLPKVIKERFCKLDATEVEQYKVQLLDYLKMSLDNYLSVMIMGSKSLAVYRLVSLWFNEGNNDLTEVGELIQAKLPSVSSDKLVPLLYQMAARMSLPTSSAADFSSVLYGAMVRASRDHPHHAVPIILALVHAKEDEQFVDGSKSSQNKENDPRASAAAKLINELEKNSKLKTTVIRYRFLCKSLIELAYLKADANKTGSLAIPASQNILKVKNWDDVAVLTDTVLVRPDKDYSNICGISKFSDKFSMVGGVNAPKKISCRGGDGGERPQLVKGKDDLRQDAVMEQVFGLLNELLELNSETRKKRLHVRTYKVVPLSQRSGVLEWCSNTQPISLYLEGADKKSGAHKRFHPKELESKQCRMEMNKAAKSSLGIKLQVFKKICSRFSPAMKYFFFEKFPSAGSYHQAVTAYTRSVAVNSMVGHILGLGDRHTNNILIDNFSGEIIHIDLGVAFEQGRILPTPETIPFRLTRDMVDGFGPAGVEGVFRQCCEASLRVLRDNSLAVLTVLEVLLHDPLYNWSVGPGKAASRQEAGQWEQLQKENDGGNKMANRALLVLTSKLEGREEGALLSVEGQVGVLIQKARDPENLCAVFEGWAQWC